MTHKPIFANLRSRSSTVLKSIAASEATCPATARPKSREGRKQIAGSFTPAMSLAMHMLALRQGRSLQALMVEAFDDVLKKHGENPIGR